MASASSVKIYKYKISDPQKTIFRLFFDHTINDKGEIEKSIKDGLFHYPIKELPIIIIKNHQKNTYEVLSTNEHYARCVKENVSNKLSELSNITLYPVDSIITKLGPKNVRKVVFSPYDSWYDLPDITTRPNEYTFSQSSKHSTAYLFIDKSTLNKYLNCAWERRSRLVSFYRQKKPSYKVKGGNKTRKHKHKKKKRKSKRRPNTRKYKRRKR